ncbi:MAG TPA: hypothetical protein VLO11_00500, partial [Luteolibacter sp.]|nr:hypothetical protein [Luteolibacter sp.]
MTKKRNHTIGALASVAVLLATGPTWAQTTPGFAFEVDAGLDDGANAIWEASPGTTGANIEFALDGTVTWGAIGSTSTQLTHAYDFPGGLVGSGSEAGDGGGKLSKISDGPGECWSFQDGPTPGGWDVQDVTMEIWFRPDNLTPP